MAMAMGWRKRLRRGGRFGWLGRIDGVEKPAILLGLGLVLYRVWRTGDSERPVKGRLRAAFGRLRDQLSRRFKSATEQPAPDEPPAPVAHEPPPARPSPPS